MSVVSKVIDLVIIIQMVRRLFKADYPNQSRRSMAEEEEEYFVLQLEIVFDGEEELIEGL